MTEKEIKPIKKNGIRWVIIAVSSVLALLLLVPLGLSFFSFPMPGDDYANTLTTVDAWKSEGTIISVLTAAFSHAVDIYKNIQGNFTGVFIMALNPLLISPGVYQWVLLGINLLFMVSVIWMMMALVGKRWGIERNKVLLFTLLLLFVHYNRLMSFIEFGSNFTSAGYYALPFSLAMIYLVLLLKINQSEKKCTGHIVVLVLLSAFLGLNNFPLAIMMLAGLGFMALFAIIKKHRRKRAFLILFFVFAAFFALSLFAPGNSRRADSEWSANVSLVKVAYSSVVMGTKLILTALVSTPILGAMVLLTPMLAKSAQNNNGRFTHPLLLAVLTYIIFIAQYAPVLYASGYEYYGRIENIKWVTSLIWIVINYINLVGYWAQRHEIKRPKRLTAATAVIGSVMVLFCLWAYYLAPAKIDDALYAHRLNYETIYRQMATGQLQTFREEQIDRFEILEDVDIVDVEFSPLTYERVICGQETLFEDEDANRNRVLARHYDKNYILVLPKE
ncbi:MAG: DUF6056 family protein [Eubacteriales bacterium]